MTTEYDYDNLGLLAAEKKIDRVAGEFEQAKARLYRQKDGQPLYGPEEMRERLAELLEPVKLVAAEAKEVAEKVRARCDEEAKLTNADPLLRLTDPAEQAEVSYKQGLIENDATKLALPALTERLEAITLHGSKVEKLLYARFARRRIEEVQRQIQNQSRSNPMSWGENMSPNRGYTVPEGYGQVQRALEALEATTVDTKLQERLKRAEARRNSATKLTMHATQRLRDADGSNERSRQQYAQRMRSMF